MNTKSNDMKLRLRPLGSALTALACLVLASGCSSEGESGSPAESGGDVLKGTVGAKGGELVGQVGSALEGVRLTIPAGALSEDTEIEIRPSAASNTVPLPETAFECGPEFSISPAGLALAKPATLTLPFDEQKVTEHYRFDDEVKAWQLDDANAKWAQRLQTESSEGAVVVELDTLSTLSAGVNPPADQDLVRFDLKPTAANLKCLAQYPGDPDRQPTAHVIVVRGDQNDALFLTGEYVKPGLQFDMFTVQNASAPFGMAWYQSDLEANRKGRLFVNIRTILLDQIFGFDPLVSLGPTNTFNLGFWFNQPEDAAACGFDVSKPLPFNGEHRSGPLAMITVPDATTGLGPLCTKPNTSTTPATCDP